MQIDENLTWNEHIKELVKKIASGIGSLKRVRSCIPATTLNTVYNSLVQSHFDYCSEIDYYSQRNLQKAVIVYKSLNGLQGV